MKGFLPFYNQEPVAHVQFSAKRLTPHVERTLSTTDQCARAALW